MKRHANAIWRGGLKDGAGTVTTPRSGALGELPYSFHTRFENEDGRDGTNPEELIAAAHAGCFAMQLSAQLTEAGHPPAELRAEAAVEIIAGTGITGSHLTVEGNVPGLSEADFLAQAEQAKVNCPVSGALKAIEITLEAKLVS